MSSGRPRPPIDRGAGAQRRRATAVLYAGAQR